MANRSDDRNEYPQGRWSSRRGDEPRMSDRYREDDDERAFLLRILLIHDYRRLLLRDPELPEVLLPAAWPGHQARLLCKELYRRLETASGRHLFRHFRLADDSVPAKDAGMAERFPEADPLGG